MPKDGLARKLDEIPVHPDVGSVADAQSFLELVQGGAAGARLVTTLELGLKLFTHDLAC
jgi:hypothetical protein